MPYAAFPAVAPRNGLTLVKLYIAAFPKAYRNFSLFESLNELNSFIVVGSSGSGKSYYTKLEILRTLHSFDPCLACSTHVIGDDGGELVRVQVR